MLHRVIPSSSKPVTPILPVSRIVTSSRNDSRAALSHSRFRAWYAKRAGIPDVLVKVLLIHRGEDDLEHFRVRHPLRLQAESLRLTRKGLRVDLRVRESHGELQVVAVQATPTFLHAHVFTEWHSPLIAPESCVETERFYSEGVPIPLGNGIPVKSWAWI